MGERTEYREGYIEADAAGTFTAAYLNRLADKPYYALAGQGYRIASVEAAKTFIDTAIAAMESPEMHLWRDTDPDCYHGWQARGGDLHKCAQLSELTQYVSGNGYMVSDSVAAALGTEIVSETGARTVRFTATDVTRVAGMVAEWRAKRAAQRAGDVSLQMVRCDCGHSVPRIQRMSASLGSSCPDCYDRMSD